MSRPAQLEQQIARVKELQAEMSEGEKQVVEAPVTPPVEKPAEPITPVVVESPATVSKEEYNKLEQAYRTLQGMHRADITRARSEAASQAEAIQALEARLNEMQKTAHVPAAPTKYVTDADEEEYGETLNMMRRAAREEAEAIAVKREEALMDRIAQLEAQTGHLSKTIVPTVENITKAQEEQIKADFWGAINTKVPDWRTVNDDANFKAWLLAEDPVTGSNRQYFLDQARNEYNASRVIRFFEEWKRTQAGGPTPAPKPNTQAELEKLVAPGASKGMTPTNTEKKQWTGKDIEKFYADIRNGVFAGKQDERKRLEDDLFLAQKEGRVS